jgi:hypothetical protein
LGSPALSQWLAIAPRQREPDTSANQKSVHPYLLARLAREEAEGIAPAVVEEARQAVREAIAQRDVDRLRAKGVLPRGEPAG